MSILTSKCKPTCCRIHITNIDCKHESHATCLCNNNTCKSTISGQALASNGSH